MIKFFLILRSLYNKGGRFSKAVEISSAFQKRSHYHVCGGCDAVWSHGSEYRGDYHAHLCPNCGDGPHWQAFFGRGE